jgi:uncharacterized membrane protein YkoI
MEIAEAIRRAQESADVKKLKDYFLASCFACVKKTDEIINDWTLLYYDPKTEKAVDCFVNDKYVTVSKETRPVSKINEPILGDLKITIERALEIAQNRFAKSTINILITLHQKSALTWTINMIGADLSVITYDIDAKNGKVTGEESTSLIRKLDKDK